VVPPRVHVNFFLDAGGGADGGTGANVDKTQRFVYDGRIELPRGGTVTVYAIGDMHGCLDALVRLLDLVSRDADARGEERPLLVTLGDYVDRGPDSKGVLDLLSSGKLAERFEPVHICGNHDACMLTILEDIGEGVFDRALVAEWISVGGKEALESYGVALRAGRGPERFLLDFAKAVPPEHRVFLSTLAVTWRRGDLFFSHAGVDPDVPLAGQKQSVLLRGCSAMFEHDHEWLAPRLRETLGARIVHGHWSTPGGVEVWPHRIGVDTGAGLGGRLSAVAIDGDDVRVIA
jgi:serine/threonine protein phosphatase 1